MNIIIFGVGILIGMYVRDIKFSVVEEYKVIQKIVEEYRAGKQAQFFEPETVEEKFKKSEKIDDFIKKL